MSEFLRRVAFSIVTGVIAGVIANAVWRVLAG